MKSRHQHYKGRQFYLEGISLSSLAKKIGTPYYAYSQGAIEDSLNAYQTAFQEIPHLICYALKASSNLAIGRVLSRRGAGVDIVSGGELRRALKSGFSPKKIIFSGVGKTKDELTLAIKFGIRLINVESSEELKALSEVSSHLKQTAPFSLRVNPDVRAGGHPHISTGTPKNKFGVYHKNIFPLYRWAARQPFLKPVGIQAHIGSQITRVAPYRRSLMVLLELHRRLEAIGIHLDIIDLGGGLGVDYQNDHPQAPRELAALVVKELKKRNLTLFLEPGRSMVAQSGVLVTQVLYRKDAGNKKFVIVDAAMNDLARPALYDAYHEIIPVQKTNGRKQPVDVVGPICESGDYLARNRELTVPKQGDYLSILSAGAYGFAMSSQYNARPRVPEVLISGNQYHVIREREEFADLIRGEKIPKHLLKNA